MRVGRKESKLSQFVMKLPRSEPSGSMINMNRQEITLFDIMTKLFPKDGKVGAVGVFAISEIWLGNISGFREGFRLWYYQNNLVGLKTEKVGG